jgi:hypothetical protein
MIVYSVRLDVVHRVLSEREKAVNEVLSKQL